MGYDLAFAIFKSNCIILVFYFICWFANKFRAKKKSVNFDIQMNSPINEDISTTIERNIEKNMTTTFKSVSRLVNKNVYGTKIPVGGLLNAKGWKRALAHFSLKRFFMSLIEYDCNLDVKLQQARALFFLQET